MKKQQVIDILEAYKPSGNIYNGYNSIEEKIDERICYLIDEIIGRVKQEPDNDWIKCSERLPEESDGTVLPTHVTIRSANRISTALCEQINTVSIERIANYMGECTADEMKQVDQALAVSVGLELCSRAEIIDAERQAQEAKLKVTDLMIQCAEGKQNAMKLEAERDAIKSLFKSTIQEIISKQ